MSSEAASRPTVALAMATANEAKNAMETHEAVCAKQYELLGRDVAAINKAIDGIRKAMNWVATTGVMAAIGFIGWTGAQWIQAAGVDSKAARAARVEQATQIEFLKSQVVSLTAQLHPGQVVVNQPGRADPMASTATADDATP